MIPKKKRRKIVIDNIIYYYKVSGCVDVVIQNTETNEIITHHEEWKEKWHYSMTPSIIENIIKGRRVKVNSY